MNNYAIPNLIKACKIMNVLADRPNGISAAELESLLEIPRTTAFRILKTLCSQDMVEKRGTLFFAGPGLMQIGLNSLRSLEIRSLSIPFLSELATKTGFTAHLATPTGWQSLILEVHDSPNPVRVASRSGTTVPLHCSSTGKIFLAYRFKDNLEDYFSQAAAARFTKNTIVTLSEMKIEVESIRKQGYAVDDQEYHEDVRCLAAPVRDSRGQVTVAIGVTGPVSSFTKERKEFVKECVLEASLLLSRSLGYAMD